MAAFSDTAFNTSAFSVNAFDIGGAIPSTPPPPAAAGPLVGGGYNPSQGLYPRPPDKQQVSKARKRVGLEDEVARAIAQIAAGQAARLELDAQKRFEELNRELQLRDIQWDAQYLDTLNQARERLIDAEIATRLKAKLRADDEIIVFMLLAASV